MAQVPQHLIDEATKRGIVPGAVIGCAWNGKQGSVDVHENWHFNEKAGVIECGRKADGFVMYANSSDNSWARVIKPPTTAATYMHFKVKKGAVVIAIPNNVIREMAANLKD